MQYVEGHTLEAWASSESGNLVPAGFYGAYFILVVEGSDASLHCIALDTSNANNFSIAHRVQLHCVQFAALLFIAAQRLSPFFFIVIYKLWNADLLPTAMYGLLCSFFCGCVRTVPPLFRCTYHIQICSASLLAKHSSHVCASFTLVCLSDA